MRVLITSGGTREPIDGVRVIANSSTGATGAALADAFSAAGFAVTLLRARHSVAPTSPVDEHFFTTVAELDQACQTLLSSHSFGLVIHAAAVSDFVVETVTVDGIPHPAPFTGKLHSSARLSLELAPGKKILPELKSYSQNPALKLVGFKLTEGAGPDETRIAVEKVLAAGADLVVHNDQQTMQQTRATLWDHAGPGAPLPTLLTLCDALVGYAKAL
ncbi:phosphopantothenoylcysteine decarboxylase [Armatimonas rosea]|uniref:Phosphopantothenoylcysteine synthetase/decarboxylase n=1 Tax=Armatimonas rosea TaxID=685828 RepID=A0A7W9SRU8_ARMRO|nr:phosphopantothenoylcysteine synthetase/decarboxylase [Armatimonas rosea]